MAFRRRPTQGVCLLNQFLSELLTSYMFYLSIFCIPISCCRRLLHTSMSTINFDFENCSSVAGEEGSQAWNVILYENFVPHAPIAGPPILVHIRSQLESLSVQYLILENFVCYFQKHPRGSAFFGSEISWI